MLRRVKTSIPRYLWAAREDFGQALGCLYFLVGVVLLSPGRALFSPVCEVCLYLCGVVAKYVPWFIRCFISRRCFPSPAAAVFGCRSVYLHSAIPQVLSHALSRRWCVLGKRSRSILGQNYHLMCAWNNSISESDLPWRSPWTVRALVNVGFQFYF